MDIRYVVMGASLGVSLLMLVGKLSAYVITGSAAILADASESIVHLAATSFGEPRLLLDGFAADPGTVAGRDEFRGTGGSLWARYRRIANE